MYKRLGYISQAMPGTDTVVLDGIVNRSQSYNQKLGVSGILLHHQTRIVQFLEGAVYDVDLLFSRIAQDKRHDGVQIIAEDMVASRLFPNWSMEYCDTKYRRPVVHALANINHDDPYLREAAVKRLLVYLSAFHEGQVLARQGPARVSVTDSVFSVA